MGINTDGASQVLDLHQEIKFQEIKFNGVNISDFDACRNGRVLPFDITVFFEQMGPGGLRLDTINPHSELWRDLKGWAWDCVKDHHKEIDCRQYEMRLLKVAGADSSYYIEFRVRPDTSLD